MKKKKTSPPPSGKPFPENEFEPNGSYEPVDIPDEAKGGVDHLDPAPIEHEVESGLSVTFVDRETGYLNSRDFGPEELSMLLALSKATGKPLATIITEIISEGLPDE